MALPARLVARARLDVDERRSRLLALGLELFGRRTFEAISIDDIAAKAGISRGLLYHYFRSKRGFYVETIRFAAAGLRERIEPNPDLPPRERLEQGLAAYLDYVSNFGDAYATLLRGGGAGDDDEVRTIVEETRAGIIADMVAGLGLQVDAPLVRVALRGWLGMVEFSAIEWMGRQRERGRSREAAVPRDQLIAVLIAACEATLARALAPALE